MGIKVENLNKSYRSQIAVNNISFELRNGEIVGFIGPNGSGKSTTMKAICGIITPDKGTILCNDIDIAENPVEAKKNIGYLAEHNPLYLDMYVTEYLEYTGSLHKIPLLQKRIKEVIEQTGLTIEKRKKIAELSKGYRQRVGLAQALIHNPDILILDEPTTGLDPNQILEIRQLISQLSEEKTVMLSTHILQEVEAICDRVIMINNGNLVMDDTTIDIKKRSAAEKQIVFVEFKEEISAALVQEFSFIDNYKKISNTEFIFEGKPGSDDIREELFIQASKNNLHILSMQKHMKTLEETFRQLSGDKK